MSKKFGLQHRRDTTIIGAKSSRIFIPSNAFQLPENVTKNDSITIQLSEFTKKADYILFDIYTVTEEKVLETEGMMHISATYNNKEIELKQGKNLVVHFKKGYGSNFKLFYPKNPQSKASVNEWVEADPLTKPAVKIYLYSYTALPSGFLPEFDIQSLNYSDSTYGVNEPKLFANQCQLSKETVKYLNGTRSLSLRTYLSPEGKFKKILFMDDYPSYAMQEVEKLLNEMPAIEPCLDKDNKPAELQCWLSISGIDSLPLHEANLDYAKSFKPGYAKNEPFEAVTNIERAQSTYNIFSVNRLGWLGCMNYIDSPTADFVFTPTKNTAGLENIAFKMTFNFHNSIVPVVSNNNLHVFKNVPYGEEVKIMYIHSKEENIKCGFLHAKTDTILDKDIEFYEDDIQSVVNIY